MKVKLGSIKPAEESFVAIMKSSMPIKLSYAVAKNLKKLAVELDDIGKAYQELLKKYGEKDEKTGQMQTKPENAEIFNKECEDLISQEVELDIWKISLSKLSDAGVKITPQQVLALENFIDDDLPKDTVPIISPTPSVVSAPVVLDPVLPPVNDVKTSG